MALISWVPTEERIRFPWISNAGFVLICYGGSAVISAFRPSRARTVLSLAFVIGFTYLQFVAYMDMPFWASYGLLTNWPHNVIEYVERFLFDVQEETPWQKVRGRPQREVEKRKTPQDLWRRFIWGVEISCNPRGVGWSYEEKHIPDGPPPNTSRSTYLPRKLSYMCWLFFLKQQVNIVAAHLVADGRYLDDGKGPVTATFFTLPMWQRLLAVWLNLLNSYYSIAVIGSLITVTGVVLGFYEPHECPPVNGPLSEFYTVRKAWGVVWHQHLRRATGFVGTLIANDILGFKKGTFGSRYIQLFAGFATSAAIHIYSSYVLLGYGNDEWTFYLSQAVAIMTEDHVVQLGQALGLKPNALWKTVGLFWVILWFSYSLQGWTGRLIEHGTLLYDTPFDPFGLDNWLRHHHIFDYQMR